MRIKVKEAVGSEQEEMVIKSRACCPGDGRHVFTCPSVIIFSEFGLLVHDHTSDGHVRVLLFGLLYSLGQRLTPPTAKTINTNQRLKRK